MNAQAAVMIGSFMTPKEVADFYGVEPLEYNKESSEILKRICVDRKYFTVSESKKLKIWRFSIEDKERLTDVKSFLFESLSTGKQWRPEFFVDFVNYSEAITQVNKQYPYGKMSTAVRIEYIKKIDQLLNDKLVKIFY
jgi:hypothetical protein